MNLRKTLDPCCMWVLKGLAGTLFSMASLYYHTMKKSIMALLRILIPLEEFSKEHFAFFLAGHHN